MYSSQLNIFLLSFGALQGALLAVLLLRRGLRQTGNLLLLLYLLTLLLQVLMKVANKAWLWQNTYSLYQISYLLPWLYGPLLYLFVRNRLRVPAEKPGGNSKLPPGLPTTTPRLKPWAKGLIYSPYFGDALHFSPFFFWLIVLYIAHIGTVPSFLALSASVAFVLQASSLVIYHWLVLRLLRQEAGVWSSPPTPRRGNSLEMGSNARFSLSDLVPKRFPLRGLGGELPAANGLKTKPIAPEYLRWLRQFATASLAVTLTLALALAVMYVKHPHWSEIRYLFASATLFFYWVSYRAMHSPQLFSMRSLNTQNGNGHGNGGLNGNGHSILKKYGNSTLKEGEIAALLASLEGLMAKERPYLNPELSIDMLAERLGSKRHHLSQVINERLNVNFFDYLNGYRVRAAQSLLADPAHAHLKIAALAYDAGFNSLSTFNEAFKKHLGQTPSHFRKLGLEAHPHTVSKTL